VFDGCVRLEEVKVRRALMFLMIRRGKLQGIREN
jgi:hypothetical protein